MTVGEGHRLQIAAGLLSEVSWWPEAGGPVECIALAGVQGSLVLILELPERYQAGIARLGLQEAGIGQVASPGSALARYFATSWSVKIAADGRVTMPEEARKLGLSPARGQRAVVYARRDRIEIWARDRWLEQVEQGARRLEELLETALEEV